MDGSSSSLELSAGAATKSSKDIPHSSVLQMFSRPDAPYATPCYAVTTVAALLTAVGLLTEPLIIVFVAAVLSGWGEMSGRCGASHIGTLTSLSNRQKNGFIWVQALSAYTAGGLITSYLVGVLIASVGGVLFGNHPGIAFSLAFIVALAVLFREIGFSHIKLPQVDRQTQRTWAHRFGIVPASGMWGAHIGIGFATVIKHGGFYPLVCVCMAFGPGIGEWIFVVYWLSRTLPLWVAPSVMRTSQSNDIPIAAVLRSGKPIRVVAISGIICFALAMAVQLNWLFG